MEKDSSLFFRELKEKVSAYAELKLEYFKLSSYEIVGKAAGKLSYGLILIIGGLWAVLFLLLALGFFLGDVFNSFGLGFLCVAVILLIILGIIILCKDWIKIKIINRSLKGISALEEELEKEYGTTKTSDAAGAAVRTEEGDQVTD